MLPMAKPTHLSGVIGNLKNIRERTNTHKGIEANEIAAADELTNCNAHGRAKNGSVENAVP
jgi:hypothetical protein